MSGWGQPNQGQQGWGQPNQGQQGWGQPNQGQQGWGQPSNNSQGWDKPNQGQGWSQHSQGQHWGEGQKTTSLFNQYTQYNLITALDHNMALDVSGDPKTKDSLIIWKKHGQQNQKFRFKHINGRYQIISSQGQFVVGVADSSNGVQAHAGLPNNSPNQLWQIHPAKGEKDAFYIKSFCGKALDVCGQKKSKGTKVIQWDYNGQKNQIWYIRPA